MHTSLHIHSRASQSKAHVRKEAIFELDRTCDGNLYSSNANLDGSASDEMHGWKNPTALRNVGKKKKKNATYIFESSTAFISPTIKRKKNNDWLKRMITKKKKATHLFLFFLKDNINPSFTAEQGYFFFFFISSQNMNSEAE